MGLYDRIMHLETPAISGHHFCGAVYEFVTGQKTAADIKTVFALDATASAELDTLLTSISGSLATKAQRVAEIHFVLMIAEGRVFYATAAAVKTRLGV